MRNAFIEKLVALAHQNDNIALVVGDLGYSVIENFAREFPDRFINAGVAEQNMTGLAAGMASEGYHVFTYSIANFPTFRCAEQFRNDIDYQGLPVTVVAVGGGLAYGAMGYSHHAIQDLALMRVMPNTLIAAPGDPLEAASCLEYLVTNPQPSYLRLGKTGEKTFHSRAPSLVPGEWVKVHVSPSSDNVILCTGATLSIAMDMIAMKQYQEYSVFTLPLWSMKCKSSQPKQVAQCSKVITLENHLHDAGFGSWLMESLQEHPELRERVLSIGYDPVVAGSVGSEGYLNQLGGLTAKHNLMS
jgi:transketolase